jgi:hypothetical protein
MAALSASTLEWLTNTSLSSKSPRSHLPLLHKASRSTDEEGRTVPSALIGRPRYISDYALQTTGTDAVHHALMAKIDHLLFWEGPSVNAVSQHVHSPRLSLSGFMKKATSFRRIPDIASTFLTWQRFGFHCDMVVC